jgi:hypothetical protein
MGVRRLGVCVLALILSALLLAPTAGGSPSGVPRLELRAATDRVDVYKYGPRDRVWLDLGVYLAAHDAPFEIRVARATYDDPVGVWQVFRRS